jgi:hypothetical protein
MLDLAEKGFQEKIIKLQQNKLDYLLMAGYLNGILKLDVKVRGCIHNILFLCNLRICPIMTDLPIMGVIARSLPIEWTTIQCSLSNIKLGCTLLLTKKKKFYQHRHQGCFLLVQVGQLLLQVLVHHRVAGDVPGSAGSSSVLNYRVPVGKKLH